MINLPPADWKHIQAQIAAASKQSMHAGIEYVCSIDGVACLQVVDVVVATIVSRGRLGWKPGKLQRTGLLFRV